MEKAMNDIVQEMRDCAEQMDEDGYGPSLAKLIRSWADRLQAQEQGAEGWRPIESAPKDGIHILIRGGSWADDSETFCQWRPFDGVKIVYWKGDEWCGGFGKAFNSEFWHKPTEWRSLP
jgi:hypothetical protein